MLKEWEVLMVPPSRERRCDDHDVVFRRCVESVNAKVAACHPTQQQQQQQGRPPREGLDLGGATGEGEECVGGEDGGEREPARELDVTGVDYGRPLGASSVSSTGFYAFPRTPEGVLISPSRGHSTKMDSQDFGGSRAPAVNGFSAAAPRRAPLTGEKIYAANGRQNGVVGLSEKRMRNGVALASSSAPSGVGNRSGEGEVSPMWGEEEEEDCGKEEEEEQEEEEPLRKRAHISADAVDDVLGNAKAWATENGHRGLERYSPTLKEQELELPHEANKPPSDSEAQAGLAPPPPSDSEAQAGLAPPPPDSEAQAGLAPPPSDSEAQAGFAPPPPPPAADADADAEAAAGDVLVRRLSKGKNEQGEFQYQFVRRDTTTTTPPKKLHEEEEEEEAKTSGDPDVKIELVSLRTEGNGDVGGVAEGEAVQLSDGGMNDEVPSLGPEETIPGAGEEERLDTLVGARFYDFSTAMEVDPNPTFSADFAENPSARAAAEPVDEEMQQEEEQEEQEQEQETVSERDDATAGAPEPPVFGPTTNGPTFGRVFDEVRRESGNSADPSGRRRSQDLNQPPPPPHAANHANHVGQKRSVEVIEFDSDDDEEPSDDDVREVKESDGSSTKGRIPVSQQRRNGYRYHTSESTPPSENAEEESDSDDCQVVGSRPPYAQNVASLRRQQSAVAANLAGASLLRQSAAANPVVVDVVDEDEENYTTSGQSSDSSDVEEVADTQSEIRRRWEEAAMRRRMGRTMQSAGSQLRGGRDGGAINLGDDGTESQGLEESVATSTYRDSPDSKDQTETSEARGGPEGGGVGGSVHRTGGAQPTVASRVSEEQRPAQWRPFMDSNGNHAVKPPEMPAAAPRRPISVDINAPGEAADEEAYDALLSKQHVRVDVPGVGRAELDKLGTLSAAAQVRSASHKEETSSRSADQQQNGDVRWEDVRWQGQQQRGVAVAEGLDIEPSENGGAAVGNAAEEATEASTAGAAAALVAAAHEDDAVENADEEASTAAAPPSAAAAAVASDEDLLEGKDKLKQTLHYKKTEEAEWASRQVEIERQAMEVKRLRHRKRQEADRKREMERKQKERIEELRLSQRKEERNMDLRDQLRGQVRAELERVAATCKDFATLLRQLGVPVEGGSHPSEKQVNAAYKKALFKFHPDRAVASSGGEPKYQVEAEEKFKLIQRLKDTLQPVVYNDYGISNKYSRPIF